jgi:hypothetical protein
MESVFAEQLATETILSAVAHHEAGHLVIAASLGLAMRPGGLSIDPVGEGLACYCFRPKESAESQERVVLATFAGWYAQERFSELRNIPCPEFAHPGSTRDWWDAVDIVSKLAGRNYFAVKEALERRSRELVQQYWDAIEILANRVLAKDWEPLKTFESGYIWSKQTVAKYVLGEEVVSVLAGCGIETRCTSEW